jgi:hypothetical protein
VVGEREGRVTQLRRPRDEQLRERGPIEKRECRMTVQFYVR